MPKFKATHFGRKRALALFAQGKSQGEVLGYLAKRHPNVPTAEVRKAYFPSLGAFAIQSAQGESRMQILDRLRKMNAGRTRLIKVRSDPEMAKRLAMGASERMKARMQNPQERRRASLRLKAMNANPEFREKNEAATSAALRKKFREDADFRARIAEHGRKNIIKWNKENPEKRIITSRKGGLATRQKRKTDPVFAQQVSQRSRELFIRLNSENPRMASDAAQLGGAAIAKRIREDPELRAGYVKRGREIMLAKRKDPEFNRKMNEAILKFLKKRREGMIGLQEELGTTAVWGERTSEGIPQRTVAIEDKAVHNNERQRVINGAVEKLSEAEKEVVLLVFGLKEGNAMHLGQTAEALGKPLAEVEALFKEAVQKLAKDKALAELV